MQARDAHVEPLYARGQNEDGCFDYISRWEVIADVDNAAGGMTYYRHEVQFRTRDDAQALLDRIQAQGRQINLAHWVEIGQDNRTWEDMEYEWEQVAYRERCGLPL